MNRVPERVHVRAKSKARLIGAGDEIFVWFRLFSQLKYVYSQLQKRP